MNDEKSAVRETVLTSLGNLKDPQTIPYLMEALHDKLYGTQEVAIDALGNMGSIAVQPILDKLKSLQDHQNRTDEEEITIRGLGKALGLYQKHDSIFSRRARKPILAEGDIQLPKLVSDMKERDLP